MTVEFALALPAVVLVLALAMSALAWMLELQSAQRSAAEAARAAITQTTAVALEAAAHAGARGDVSVTRDGGYITACVQVNRPPWPRSARCATARDSP